MRRGKSHRYREMTEQSGIDYAVAYSIADYFTDRVHVQFPHQICSVCLRGLGAYSQDRSHLLAALPLGNELNGFAFPWRKEKVLVLG